MGGYTGKILRIDLSAGSTSTIDTQQYQQWGGGHGIGSALFWDLVEDKTISGFDPGNVVTVMTSPLTGTVVPGAGSRTEVQGIGVQSSPEWFTCSNFGGRFGAMLKYAGWDGIVIEGKAESPVWIDIRDDHVEIKNGRPLWGRDTWETQQEIWQEVSGRSHYGGWLEVGSGGARSTQRPAVLTIGPAGENLCRVACLIHDAGSAAGQGGFGAVWGSKNLKAISVIGTGHVSIADPKALMDARVWSYQYKQSVDEPIQGMNMMFDTVPSHFRGYPYPVTGWLREVQSRPQACVSCTAGCRSRNASGVGNESSCMESTFYRFWGLSQQIASAVNAEAMKRQYAGEDTTSLKELYTVLNPLSEQKAAELCNRLGINVYEFNTGFRYLRDLHEMGVLGKGKEIDSGNIPFDKLGTAELAEKLFNAVAYREGIGDDLAEGFFRAAQKWGRAEDDLATGILENPQWGLPAHQDPRICPDWAYGTLFGDRDTDEHDFDPLRMLPSMLLMSGIQPPLSAEQMVRLHYEKMVPFENDPLMLSFSADNIYSEHIAKFVAWHRHYTRFWKRSVLYCDFNYPDFVNFAMPDAKGLTGEAEPKFFNAVTGMNITFAEGIEIGRKIWNLDNAIWTRQGRVRDMVRFAGYVFDVPTPFTFFLTAFENGEWIYKRVTGITLDRDGVEEFKTAFYTLEGWDPETGWPTRETLEGLGMGSVADELAAHSTLGR